MKLLMPIMVLSAWVVCYSVSQTKIVGRLVGLDPAIADSVNIAVKNGTGELFYSQTHLSRNSTFNISSRETGGLLLDISCPGFNSAQVPILTIGSTTDSVEIQLSPVSKHRDESRITFHDSSSLAARFAAKEAVLKALGTCDSGIGWRDIEVLSDSHGRPTITLAGKAREVARALGVHSLDVSLSHAECYAVAFCVGTGASENAA